MLAAHNKAAVFDLSPFGKIDVVGPDAEAFLLQTCAGYMDRKPGSVIYSAVLNARGTFESDITAQRISQTHYRLFVGTTAIRKDMAWFKQAALSGNNHSGFDVTVSDVSEDFGALALMGPESFNVVRELGADLRSIGFFKHSTCSLAGIEVRAARMSYVGESGCEITCKSTDVKTLFEALLAKGVKPAGLFAQTSMRIEKGFRAMGHELDSDVTPMDVGLAMFTRNMGGFTGYDALEAQQSKAGTHQVMLLTFSDTEAVPIGHEPVLQAGAIIGKTTSCAFGYRIGRPIALAHVSSNFDAQTHLSVNIAGQLFDVTASRVAAFDPEGLRMKV